MNTQYSQGSHLESGHLEDREDETEIYNRDKVCEHGRWMKVTQSGFSGGFFDVNGVELFDTVIESYYDTYVR
jgi:hypothetical protein